MRNMILAVLASFALAGAAEPFDRAFQFLLKHELSTYCDDGGYESRYGISKRWYPQEDIEHLTEERAREIYYTDYWCRIGANVMGDTLLALLYMVFAVHCGQPTAMAAQKDCWDREVLFDKYVDRLCVILSKNMEKRRFTKSWVLRVSYLAAAINLNR